MQLKFKFVLLLKMTNEEVYLNLSYIIVNTPLTVRGSHPLPRILRPLSLCFGQRFPASHCNREAPPPPCPQSVTPATPQDSLRLSFGIKPKLVDLTSGWEGVKLKMIPSESIKFGRILNITRLSLTLRVSH